MSNVNYQHMSPCPSPCAVQAPEDAVRMCLRLLGHLGPSGGAVRVGERWARSRASRLAELVLGWRAEWMSSGWLISGVGVVWSAWAVMNVRQTGGQEGQLGGSDHKIGAGMWCRVVWLVKARWLSSVRLWPYRILGHTLLGSWTSPGMAQWLIWKGRHWTTGI